MLKLDFCSSWCILYGEFLHAALRQHRLLVSLHVDVLRFWGPFCAACCMHNLRMLRATILRNVVEVVLHAITKCIVDVWTKAWQELLPTSERCSVVASVANILL